MLKVSDLKIIQGSFVLDSVNLEINSGEYCVLMGSSGCGKTTIMESICGLRAVESGKIEVDGKDVSSLVPALRKIAYVPQDGALFPTMNVGQQIAFPALIKKKSTEQINDLVKSISESFKHFSLTRPKSGLSQWRRKATSCSGSSFGDGARGSLFR